MSNMLVGWLPEPVVLNQTGPGRKSRARPQSSNHPLCPFFTQRPGPSRETPFIGSTVPLPLFVLIRVHSRLFSYERQNLPSPSPHPGTAQ
jgi:hypothetical protein